ncbi:1-deoxy-D-xylulose-5-phosphate synthase [Pseudothermotoga thermarum]|uniref:1-deoxy-D-xylulose-5-phosphate synthase n=1 Tax=Pseudothermotoga thermarum DSM 5069 TaxID=688269 RepID=F7YXH4_9THEM|nr:1-deoxy-D-xylulose-5-phosphate synthase [Pseudothermotoga thermarum]AEH52029.1 1-deoxy-D-xylulose-5-phosphate synthase [Pseudothermotoga thermarum DSM 5069]
MYPTLDDVQKADVSQLEEYAKMIRKRIIEVVSKNGGHLASNLGVVELTLALYKVFDPRKDVVIWDTSHQCYTHKLLTGRWDKFDTLRQFNGISGYLNPLEYEYDHFALGHAGTSIAMALGIEKALKLKKLNKNVVVVIGDGALSNGEVLESLNQLKAQKSKIKIILNDNGMSIAPNVGALSEAFMQLRTSQAYVKLKELIKAFLESSEAGKNLEDELRKFKNSLKAFVTGLDFFETLGIKHVGPVDGHDLKVLVKVFQRIKDYDYPVVVHVITQKGKGFKPAEENCVMFHSSPKFDPESGEPILKQGYLSFSDVFGQALVKIASQRQDVFAITAAMPDGTGLSHFAKAFPERFVDLGITEQSCVSFAAGLAKMGFKPVVAIYSTFLQRAYDQIVHDVALQNLDVLFAVDRAGLVGEDGPTHHGIFDIAFFKPIPGSKIFAPMNLKETVSILRSIFELNVKGVVAVRYPKESEEANFEQLWKESSIIDPFRWEIVRQGQSGVAILAVGTMVKNCLKLESIDPTVVYVRCVKPLDENLLKQLIQDHDSFVTVEEGVVTGGFGESVVSFLNSLGIRKPVLCLGLKEEFVPHGSREDLLKFCGLDVKGIFDNVISFMRKEVSTWS